MIDKYTFSVETDKSYIEENSAKMCIVYVAANSYDEAFNSLYREPHNYASMLEGIPQRVYHEGTKIWWSFPGNVIERYNEQER
jgi:uncharacterized membrane protein YfhO